MTVTSSKTNIPYGILHLRATTHGYQLSQLFRSLQFRFCWYQVWDEMSFCQGNDQSDRSQRRRSTLWNLFQLIEVKVGFVHPARIHHQNSLPLRLHHQKRHFLKGK